jgi:hypothetical protein
MIIALALARERADGQATSPPVPQDDSKPGIARISLMSGDVSLQRGDAGVWVAATPNAPVAPGDRISTGPASRTELQLDYANILRLSNQSEANIAGLDRTHIQVQIAQGLAFFSVFKGSEADAEIDTPNVAVHPHGEGEFRIEVNLTGETIVVARKGEADASTSEGSTLLHSGQLITIRGAGTGAQYLTADAPPRDQWDNFNVNRDREIRGAQSWAHVNPYYTGAGDLDAYGHWIYIPDYGWVWAPAVASGWAPYRAGRWVWEPYYGWTWVSYEPWGWAPYHYGRWFLWNSSWVWWPGPLTSFYRPIWAPAYVSFLGFGAGRFGLSFGFNFGFGSIGWLPIGPCDPFFPWYGGFSARFAFMDFRRFHDRNYFRQFPGAFAPLASRYDERLSNFRMAEASPYLLRGVTSVRAEEFGSGPVRSAAGISTSDLRGVHVMTGGVPVEPTRQSLAASSRAASPSTIRNAQGNRFFGKSQTSAVSRYSFNREAGRVREALRGSARSQLHEGRQQEGAAFGGQGRPGGNLPATQPNRSAAAAERTGPPSRNPFSDRPTRNSDIQGNQISLNSPAGGSAGGWQHFSRQTDLSRQQASGIRSAGQYSSRPAAYNAPRYSTRPPLNMHRPIISGPPRSAPNRGSGGLGSGASRAGSDRPSNAQHRRKGK